MSGYKKDSLTYEWNSGIAAERGPGSWKWGGKATSTRTISVRVLSGEILLFEDEMEVVVKARSVGQHGWCFERMTHDGHAWGLPDAADEKAWGAYVAVPEYGEGAGAVREGTGPWAGEYYTYLPHRLGGRMFLHRDFDTSGEPHHSAHQTCPGQGIPASANVLTVNTLCSEQHRENLKEWMRLTIKHEQKHEDGANKCLESGTAARNALVQMEQFTGASQSTVRDDFHAVFEDFIRRSGPFKQAMETTTSTPVSPVIWEHRDNGAWTEQALRSFQHNGTDGCWKDPRKGKELT